MKTMYKKIVLRSMMLLLAVGLVFGISSCSRDDDGDGSGFSVFWQEVAENKPARSIYRCGFFIIIGF